MNRHNPLMNMFHALLDALGPCSRHGSGDPFETAVEIILGRNASRAHVETAMAGLRRDGLLDPARLYAIGEGELAERVRPAGHYRQKAAVLRRFLVFLRDRCAFDPANLASRTPDAAREELLSVRGLGPETADAILLFACDVPVFPVSAAAARLALRHGLAYEDADYAELRERYMDGLERDPRLYRECHGLIARTGREYCKPKAALCAVCPLGRFLE